MSIKEYLRDKALAIALYVLLEAIVTAVLVLFRCQIEVIVIIFTIIAFYLIFIVLWDFFRRKGFYDELVSKSALLDKKYLVLEMMREPDFYEGKIIWQQLYEINKSMTENIKKFELSGRDFKEYIQMWVHEVKLPISSISLMCHNHKNELTDRLYKQIQRIDNYTEQVLYFVRSENSNEDYHIKEFQLSEVIKRVALRNKDEILEGQIDFTVENVDMTVTSDIKWLEFMLNQIVSNSFKYAKPKERLKINIFAEEEQYVTYSLVALHIRDSGIGIVKKDLERVFNKSFTGENGKDYVKSTGMGLYIVKGLCDKLGHKIEINSVKNEYTDVKIIFTKSAYNKL